MGNQYGGSTVGTNYRGNRASQPPDYNFEPRDPTQYDSQNHEVGDFWIATYTTGNKLTINFWWLASLNGTSTSKGMLADWVLLSNGIGVLLGLQPQISGVNNGAVVVPMLGTVNINNTDVNIVPSNGGTNTLNLNLASSISVPGTITAGAGLSVVSVGATIANFVNIIGNANAVSANNELQFIRTRGVGGVLPGDQLGDLSWIGTWDGIGTIESALIRGSVPASATIAPNQVAGQIDFFTHPNSVTAMNNPTNRMTIGSDGQIIIQAPDNPASQYSLTVVQDVKAKTFYATGDDGGVASTIGISNVNSTTISTGVGSIKMSTANSATNSAWIKIYIGATAYWIPAFTTNAP